MTEYAVYTNTRAYNTDPTDPAFTAGMAAARAIFGFTGTDIPEYLEAVTNFFDNKLAVERGGVQVCYGPYADRVAFQWEGQFGQAARAFASGYQDYVLAYRDIVVYMREDDNYRKVVWSRSEEDGRTADDVFGTYREEQSAKWRAANP